MPSKWYMSACFNTGLQASRVANDAMLSMAISSANSNARTISDKHYQERLSRAIVLLDDILIRISKPQMQRLKVRNAADSTTNLVYVLIARSAGDINNLKNKIESSKQELTQALNGPAKFSSSTFKLLEKIEAAADEVVEENNASLIDVD